MTMHRFAHALILRGVSLGGSGTITGATFEGLFQAECNGLNTALIAGATSDLHNPAAQLTRFVIAADEAVLEEAERMWGREQVIAAANLERRTVLRAVRALPTPPGRTLVRRTIDVMRRTKAGQNLVDKLQRVRLTR